MDWQVNWFIKTEIDTSNPNVTNLVTGGLSDSPFNTVVYSAPPKAGPFTQRFLEATYFATKAEAQAKAILVAAMYPYFIGKLSVKRLEGKLWNAVVDYQRPGHDRPQARGRTKA